ncbi:alpha/beta hydrolase fold domain-containing protein [Primorskyibacter sp. S87]|uniref:alpha/beta hydrolase fold domain-containing protein n=1 Tax=Primorskyibacter sp. S87 TaxID=3415126 RepID=UPI003C7CE880
MSWQRRWINAALLRFEKPLLERATDPKALRRGFERRVRFWMHVPRRVKVEKSLPGGYPGWVLHPPDLSEFGRRGGTLFHIHGGAFILGSPRTHAPMLGHLSCLVGAPVMVPAYPLAPEAPFPAARNHLRETQHSLIAGGIEQERIVLGGDSAGGALAFGLLADLCKSGLPPLAAYGLSVVSDLTFSGESMSRNADREALLPAKRAQDLAEMYLGSADPFDPQASPLFAEYPSPPPVWLAASSSEVLLDDTRRLAARLRHHGGEVTERIEQNLPHVWPFFWRMLPEGRQTLAELARWISRQHPGSGES